MSLHSERPRFVVVGCGSIGKRHLRSLLALGERRILAFDPRADRCEEVTQQLGVATVSDLTDAWEQRPEAALITSPTRFHVPHALEAAERGCHLFIEKPVADSADPALTRLLEIARERRLVTLVGCNLRFHPGLLAIKSLVDAGALGRIVSIRAEFGQYLPDWHPWEDYRQGYSARRGLGGGIILDAIHEIDYIRWLAGEVEEVACFAGHLSHLEIDTEDTAVLLLKFAADRSPERAGGAFGEVHLDYVQRVHTRSCTIQGDEGTARWDFLRNQCSWYSAARRAWTEVEPPAAWETNQMYLDEMRHFLRCLSGDERSIQDVFEAKRVLDIALAAKRSAAEGVMIRMERQS